MRMEGRVFLLLVSAGCDERLEPCVEDTGVSDQLADEPTPVHTADLTELDGACTPVDGH